MVAKFNSGKSIKGALNYNEHKVKQGKARLIASNGYLQEFDRLSFDDKLFRLTDLSQRNIRATRNAVHISLNFHISEKFNPEILTNITEEYMKQIGFGDQPYLVYEHMDAGHPHVHIVTTNIKPDSKRIDLHYIGERISEPAREAVEVQFGLIKAKGNKFDQTPTETFRLLPAIYGQSDTKRAITNIVNEVTRAYKYTSLPELNAILGLYNITADKGSKESMMFKNGGLNYWIMDSSGCKIGVPIKASSIYQKPTLKLLEDRFKLNEYLRKTFKEQFKKKLNSMIPGSGSLPDLQRVLKKQDITVVVRKNAEGRVYGLTYIDHKNKVIFNGSDLGKSYSAAGILGTIQSKTDKHKFLPNVTQDSRPESEHHHFGRSLLDELLNPNDLNQSLPNQFGPRKKKKKRRNLNL